MTGSSHKEKHLLEQPYGIKITLIGRPEVKESNAASFRYGEEAAPSLKLGREEKRWPPSLVMVNGNWEEKRRGIFAVFEDLWTSTLARQRRFRTARPAGGGSEETCYGRFPPASGKGVTGKLV